MSKKMLEHCVDSIKNVDLDSSQWELIIIDDGSDVPVGIGFEGENIKVIRQQNAGAAAARNAGIDVAKGEYIQFVDADDYIITNEYNNVIQILQTQKPDVLAFGFKTESGCKTPNFGKEPLITSGVEYMMKNNIFGIPWAYVFRHDILQGLRFKQGSLHEDEHFVPLLLLRAKKLIATKITPYFYQKRQGSAVNAFDSDTINKRIDDFYNILCDHASLALRLRNQTGNTVDGIMASADALQRRTDQLSMDYIINVARLRFKENNGLSFLQRFNYVGKALKQETAKMRAEGLFPLPNKSYTLKYTLFRFISKILL